MQTEIHPSPVEHISLKNPALCRKKCPEHPCTFICPSGVFHWQGDRIRIEQEQCVECGACELACPQGNINWTLPPGGFGVVYHW
ncbi:MAG: ferredoxin family protein [Bacillota bacterium]|uniref:Ferredoxin-like protein n=2 Tax=Carboxydocella TaxID=178898 RepID=A0A1T4Q5Z7_9FIRM|nr:MULTISPECIES: 4Fe-4S dicluster domain-containing protein [Carboxydocella]AVX21176.1 ferredoxin like protein [Carboxydocella thermautotrophica]AVX31611.1 ferredoxin like protein [Carboxydocella thermautotrophica]SJZ99104.1 ferredoxin like protein [Carboxydocella sporoproducens DSM 16521]